MYPLTIGSYGVPLLAVVRHVHSKRDVGNMEALQETRRQQNLYTHTQHICPVLSEHCL